MYFPLLRGRQFDLLALRSLPSNLFHNRKVLPIIEPVRLNNNLRAVAKKGIPFALIMNPSATDKNGTALSFFEVLEYYLKGTLKGHELIFPAFYVNRYLNWEWVNTLSSEFPGLEIMFIHSERANNPDHLNRKISAIPNVGFNVFLRESVGEGYAKNFNSHTKVLISDGFNKQEANDKYVEDEYFSDLIKSHKDIGFQGFGDYTIVGVKHIEGGGLPKAVAIHLTFLNREDNTVWIKHFLSDDRGDRLNIPRKFLQANTKLVEFVENYKVPETVGVKGFKDKLQEQSFPNLGKVKEYSIAHHIELMGSMI